MNQKGRESFTLSACACGNKDRFVFAVGHNVRANMLKLKINSASIQDIALKDIQILQDNVLSADSPQLIITQYLEQALGEYTKRRGAPNDVLEFVYFGDVNLTTPGQAIFPDFFIDKNNFLYYIKSYFPNCILIKRILVSADNNILDIAKQKFSSMQPELSFPIIVDRFLNKSEQDFYTEIHRIDSGVLDAVLKYHRVFRAYASEDEEVDRDSFTPIYYDLSVIQDNLEHLEPFAQGSAHAERYKDLKLNFNRKSEYFIEQINESLSEKKSIMMSLIFSFLIPPSLRNDITSRLAAEGVAIVSDSLIHAELKFHEFGEMIDPLFKQTKDYFVLYQQTSAEMTDTTTAVLKALDAYQSSVSIADFNPDVAAIIETLINDLQYLLVRLKTKLSALVQLDPALKQLMLRVEKFTHEAQRKHTLSNETFLSEDPLDRISIRAMDITQGLATRSCDNLSGEKKSRFSFFLKKRKTVSEQSFLSETTGTYDLTPSKSLHEMSDIEEFSGDYFLGSL